MWRFVAFENKVMFDVLGKAPGRGAYIWPDAQNLVTLVQAKSKKPNPLSRALQAELPANLPVQVETALRKHCLQHLGLLKKANQLCLGAQPILENRKKLVGVLLANDAGSDTQNKLKALECETLSLFSKLELDFALNHPNLAAVGLTNAAFWPKLRALYTFQQAGLN